jgi:hypothetical protein
VDFLLTRDVEAMLSRSDGAHIPLRGSVPRPDHVKGPPAFRAMEVDWSDVAKNLDARLQELEAIWSE